ncbi:MULTISPECIES: maleylpyruvate isomerase family mycothiol-dependent enzyme [Rhodococcus]|uniref:maleylpyruvate isomerase family mycothiol-dependent enzyme n=1 Tax=Rhodococcus TaxID=1827 RepID=UPI000AD197FB|nr:MULTISPECIES: maleylpyruvate isomerase family mycothiol-dependent enzyme [Rhodococcus]KLL96213.1 hypothetical protein NJ76_17880 [Rhodococcus sp. IITR03]QHG84328.1 maleylpyruvate isomerase family mycothiol-dependent enzyme [Rhodococcus rhodochrous]QOH55935.1 hypothetical protein C6Y44_08130 [Rhodococcus rhodochrous]WAL47989.1 maleylpyruvate isomerase family mycothiol-dependent enzyme [Rhodococcus pyridinivorans]
MLNYARYCGEIVEQTELLVDSLAGQDMTTPVPSCPGWNVGQLARHIGYGHRWATEAVRGEGAMPRTDRAMRELSDYVDEDPDELIPWLREGAREFEAALREVGPNMRVWTPIPGGKKTPEFFARRFAHETMVHRADAALALGADFEPAHDLAVDCVDEWLDLAVVTWPRLDVERHRALHGPDRTLHFHATDTSAEWVVDLTGEDFAWRHAHEKSAVAVRGPLTELLLVLYRRRAVDTADVEVFGDTGFLASWLDVSPFG